MTTDPLLDFAANDRALPPVEERRLSGQCKLILAMFRCWRPDHTVTNVELAKIAKNYTARVSELRKAGHDIRVESRDHRTGVVVYKLWE